MTEFSYIEATNEFTDTVERISNAVDETMRVDASNKSVKYGRDRTLYEDYPKLADKGEFIVSRMNTTRNAVLAAVPQFSSYVAAKNQQYVSTTILRFKAIANSAELLEKEFKDATQVAIKNRQELEYKSESEILGEELTDIDAMANNLGNASRDAGLAVAKVTSDIAGGTSRGLFDGILYFIRNEPLIFIGVILLVYWLFKSGTAQRAGKALYSTGEKVAVSAAKVS